MLRDFFLLPQPPLWPGVHYVREKGQSLSWLCANRAKNNKGDWPQCK
jgi:hypothetical protein